MNNPHGVASSFQTSRPGKRPVVLHTRVVAGSGGGPDKTILNSPRFLEPLGYRALCAYFHPPGDPGFAQLEEKARRWSAPLLSIADHGPLDWRLIPQLLTICRQEKVAIWHGHDYKSNLLGLMLYPFWSMKLLTTVHGWVHHTERTPLYYAVDKLCLPRYDRVVCVSEDLYKTCRHLGIPTSRCALIENAIDTDEFSRKQSIEQAKSQAGIPAGRTILGAVGRLSPEKGFDLLIRSTAQLLERGLDLELWIIGEGVEKEALQKRITDLGQGQRIHLLGYRNDVRALYEQMDIFVLSSLREGLPNVVLEAMALEVPVLATRIAGVPKLIGDGREGLLIDPGEMGQLTKGIQRLAGNSTLRMDLAKAARKLIENRYSFTRRMEKMSRLYDEVLGRGC